MPAGKAGPLRLLLAESALSLLADRPGRTESGNGVNADVDPGNVIVPLHGEHVMPDFTKAWRVRVDRDLLAFRNHGAVQDPLDRPVADILEERRVGRGIVFHRAGDERPFAFGDGVARLDAG